VLLRLVTDSQSGEPTERQVEAWILIGVAAFFGGDDSTTVTAFRRAFALDPGVEARGLAAIDSSLAMMFEAERPRTVAEPVAAPPPSSAASESVYECVKRCPDGVSKPTLLRFPPVAAPDVPAPHSQVYPGSSGLGPSGVHGTLEFAFIVNEAGSAEPGSVTLTVNSARPWRRAFEERLMQARFRPAMLDGRPVRARVRLRVDIRAEGMDALSYQFTGP
jgi:hypothetical protein